MKSWNKSRCQQNLSDDKRKRTNRDQPWWWYHKEKTPTCTFVQKNIITRIIGARPIFSPHCFCCPFFQKKRKERFFMFLWKLFRKKASTSKQTRGDKGSAPNTKKNTCFVASRIAFQIHHQGLRSGGIHTVLGGKSSGFWCHPLLLQTYYTFDVLQRFTKPFEFNTSFICDHTNMLRRRWFCSKWSECPCPSVV